jgi:hypothetical protein
MRLRPEAVEWREIDGEVLAVDLDQARYLGVNATGALLWKELARGTTRDELVSRLQAAFGLEAERAERDTDAFLDVLRERQLLAPAPDA